ncbi:uncharacterized protein BXIN_2823 [Babesia sp. Xinjiang]|uniref:uncharacterized protein n=1 Tax=Babesia sp. Xinjiang TaxID=462227 RepID=UPI000A23F7C9|nr:uncharacterized protein BXIN_2823 [Babesia sp. Xinjiang]ORM41748.1 hypothetical protein BXIN_2823 [Babesia sp. Xinjiang]
MCASKLLQTVQRDQEFTKLQTELKNEFESDISVGGPVFRRVVENTFAAIENADTGESPVELNAECIVMLEDIAKTGRCAYPWPIVKLLLLVVWSRLFDEVYASETANGDVLVEPKDYSDERCYCLSILAAFEREPLTLQRLAEIPINQPYTKVGKLMHAFRKVIQVREMLTKETDKAGGNFCPEEIKESDIIKRTMDVIAYWGKTLENPLRHTWDDDLWLGLWDSSDTTQPVQTKRPLEA